MNLLLLAVTFLRLDPAVITDCRDGLGRAVLHWTSTDAASVTLFTEGIGLTGLELPIGSNVTGHWVAERPVVLPARSQRHDPLDDHRPRELHRPTPVAARRR